MINEEEYNKMKNPVIKKIADILSEIKDLKKIRVAKTKKSDDIDVKRGGDWKIVGNKSVFYYKVKVQNISEYVVTHVQILLTSYPTGLNIESDRYKIESLKPGAYESPSFKFTAKESCSGDVIEGIVTFVDPKGKTKTMAIEPFEIKYVCNLLVPVAVTKDEFKERTVDMEEKTLELESNISIEDLRMKLRPIVSNCNFSLLEEPMDQEDADIKIIEAFAQGLYDKKDVALSIQMERGKEQNTKISIKAMSDRIEKLTDLILDLNIKLDDIKSDTQLIKEYTSLIEDIFDRTEDLEKLLMNSLGPDFAKLKYKWQEYKQGEISKKELIISGIKIIGKKFITKLIGKFA